MRPHNDVLHDRPELSAIETLHHVRESAARWQETAERIARQRDDYLQAVKDLDAVLYASGLDDRDAVAAAIDILDGVFDR